jgi:hypothetical protein
MNATRNTVRDLLEHITSVVENDPFKHDLAVALFSTLLAQLRGMIPLHFHASYLPCSFDNKTTVFPSKSDSVKAVSMLAARGDMGTDRQKVCRRIGDFEWHKSAEWEEICRRYGGDLLHKDLLAIAKVTAIKAGLPLDRDAKRRKNVLIKWFHEHWEILSEYLPEALPVDG